MDHLHLRARLLDLVLAERRGDAAAVRQAAVSALDLLAGGPVFPRHPDVGRAVADEATTARLRRLAGPYPPTG